MSEKSSMDRRKVRTKNAIREALIALIEERGFDALSVSEIAKKANINRGTFYLHYQDIYDLLDKTRAGIIQDIEKIILQTNSLNFADFNSVDKPLPVIVSLFEYIKANANLVYAIFGREGAVSFQLQIRKTVEKNLKLEFLAGLKEKEFWVPGDYLISYAMSAHFGVIQTWLERGCIETPREMAIILSKLSWYGTVRNTGFVLP